MSNGDTNGAFKQKELPSSSNTFSPRTEPGHANEAEFQGFGPSRRWGGTTAPSLHSVFIKGVQRSAQRQTLCTPRTQTHTRVHKTQQLLMKHTFLADIYCQ